jgi:hypothetical protein
MVIFQHDRTTLIVQPHRGLEHALVARKDFRFRSLRTRALLRTPRSLIMSSDARALAMRVADDGGE